MSQLDEPVNFTSDIEVEEINTAASDLMVAHAAWVSNKSTSIDDEVDMEHVKGLINFLYREQHHSPFEHGLFTFKIKAPLFVVQEILRHRTSSFNQASARYSVLPAKFHIPHKERGLVQQGKIGSYSFGPGTEEQYEFATNERMRVSRVAWVSYKREVAAGIAKEVARGVLPHCQFTELYFTVNPRSLMHFLSLRNDAQALSEIREVAEQCEEIFKAQMPLSHEAFRQHTPLNT